VIDEPLIDSAAEAMAAAHRHCPPRCRAYHGFWQHLRLMKLGKTLSGLSESFLREIEREAARWPDQGKPAKVLISGCADYSAYAHVLAACHSVGRSAEVTALDLCETPLELSRWLAERQGESIRTVCSDILDYTTTDRHDLIVTSSFLGYFPGSVRARLFAAYSGLLKPGGLLLISNRLRAGSEETQVGFSDQAIDDFTDLVVERNAGLPAAVRLSDPVARDAARAYCAVMKSYPVNGRTSLEPIVDAVGLDWFGGGEMASHPASQTRVNAPTVSDGSTYLLIAARKR
jgi:SAM-dependent methyltransferase